MAASGVTTSPARKVGAQKAFSFHDSPPAQVKIFPQLRFMGSKARLLSWIHQVLSKLPFDTALDAFSGSGAVGYLLKAMGKQVTTNDFLNFSFTIARAIIENDEQTVSAYDHERVTRYDARHRHFIEKTFRGIFYTPQDLRFLDRVWWNLGLLSELPRTVALSALLRSCVKRQPRGVFTVSGDLANYDDGRRDLRLSLREHFAEQLAAYNACVFSNGRRNLALHGDVFAIESSDFDLVYLDPPYVPRADDNCYVKRYHFLEGLSCYWQGLTIMEDTRVRKIRKAHTPFSYRRESLAAFDRLFAQFRRSILVLSYSSNGYPDLDVLVDLMRRYKSKVVVHDQAYRYHFGTHERVQRANVREYLLVGQ